MKKAFTLIEIIFVLVVIGILASIAIPRFSVSVNDAKLTRAKVQIASVRSGIANAYSTNILAGVLAYPQSLEEGECCFAKVLSEPLKESAWSLKGESYTLQIASEKTTFSYNNTNGQFACNLKETLCKKVDY